jgi:SagB-type dehydrogenase family enzyme
MYDRKLAEYREFLKDTIRLEIDFSETDQSRGLPAPPLQKPYSLDSLRVPLPAAGHWAGIRGVDLQTAIACRESRRTFLDDPLSLDELAFLLWSTQGIRRPVDRSTALRTVPSAGARHALETYLFVFHVEGVLPGVYRYLPLEHQLLLEFIEDQLPIKLAQACLGQSFVSQSAVTFAWTAMPHRMEWRYGLAAHKVIALDAGHVCQNLYLACEAIQAGTCAIAAYHQPKIDELLRLDGQDEFVIYLAPVGKRPRLAG